MTAWWRRLSLRARLLLIGVSGVAVALAIGSVTLYAVLTLVTYRTLDNDGLATGREVADLVAQGRLPDPLPVTGNQVVQVVDTRNRVVSASLNADRLTSLLGPDEVRAALAGRRVEVSGARVGSSSPLRAVAVGTGSGASRRAVVVAQPFEDIVHSQRVLRTTLLVTYPLLLGVLALIAWRVVGAALRPVESLRRSAELISGTEEDTRLPVPASGDEVHRLAETLNSMLDRLAASRARQRSFVADAAHELRSPLASMQTQLEVSARLGEDLPAMKDLQAEVTRMTALVEDLLVLARLQEGPAPPRDVEPVDLLAVAEQVVARYAGAPVAVRLRDRPGGPPLPAAVRRDDLDRALRNLLDNGVRHARSAVQVTAGEDGGEFLVLEVCDDGDGLRPEDRERVFERFTRLDEGRARDSGGSGLGLAIARELVRRSGGDVQLDTSPSGGLAARIVLLRWREEDGAW
jgi:signal transduction histidine kinase